MKGMAGTCADISVRAPALTMRWIMLFNQQPMEWAVGNRQAAKRIAGYLDIDREPEKSYIINSLLHTGVVMRRDTGTEIGNGDDL